MSEEDFKRICPSGSRAGVMYGLPKIHKDNCPIRPVVSACGTYNYFLAKWLDEILSPLLNNNEYMLKDTFDFVNKISQMTNEEDQYMVSFDVESLFTNVPTDETIQLILDEAFNDKDTYHGLKKHTLKHLLNVCIKKSHFQFNGSYYDQIDGVSMGSPLGPFFANFFMANFEKKHMASIKERGVITYNRYVDDVFAKINNSENCDAILEFLNAQHKNIKFTIEKEKNKKIPFLDTVVTRKSNCFSINLYHKPTFTGVYLNWKSLTARRYKISLIYCLCDRIWKICKEEQERDLEMMKLREILIKNEYPVHIIDKEMNKFIKNRNHTPIDDQLVSNNNNNSVSENNKSSSNEENLIITNKPKRFIVLPYTNHKGEEFASRLSKLVNENFEVDFKVAYKTPNEIGKLFPFKDNIKKVNMQSHVIYKIECKVCKQFYIGKCKRILQHRISEHNDGEESAIKSHKKATKHKINAKDIKILDRADSDYKLKLKEAMYINKLKPQLNVQHAAAYKKKHNKELFKQQLNTIIIANIN